MRSLNSTSLIFLATLLGCSGLAPHHVNHSSHVTPARSVASVSAELNNPLAMKAKIDHLMSGIFQSYLMGQVHLVDFDKQLDKNASDALKSSSYRSLLAIRTIVDEYEHQVNELYKALVLVRASSQFAPGLKQIAQVGLKSLANYMNGIKSDNSEIPENLKPLFLTNLREKQRALFEELKEIRDVEADEQARQVIFKEMGNLRALSKALPVDLKNYKVDKEVFTEALRQEKVKKSFQQFEKDVKQVSEKMKSFMSLLGRDTSSDTIIPSAGPNGNVTGRTWPQKTWSLTYDDGPGKSTTEEILANLKERNIPATFFMLAKQVEAYPAIALKLKEAGMDMASHSYTHAQLTKVGEVQLEREIGISKRVMEEKLNTKIKLFRLPYGAGVSAGNIRSKISEHGMIHVFWTVDTLDWQDKNPQSIMNRTLKQMNVSSKNSGIVLFHDIHPQSVIASTMLMDHFNNQKLTVCTVQAVIDQINQNLPSCN
jgi:peptidoglycan/xylan/chitin deacetylase (PgdA/CDA1 family)